MSQPTTTKTFRLGQALILKHPKRQAHEVTLRRISDAADDAQAPHIVTLDSGPLAGLKLWASEAELSVRTA